MSALPKASIILPTYNEKENIEACLRQIARLQLVVEIIVVDDASPDGTAQLVRSLAAHYPVRVIERTGKLGLASALMAGMEEARSEIFICMDADLSHDTAIIPQMIRAVQLGNDVAIGSRFVSGGGMLGWPLRRQAMSWFATRIAQVMLGIRERDPMSGYFAVRRDVYTRIAHTLRPRGYKLLVEILVRARPLQTTEIGYVFQDRQYGKSKISFTIAREYAQMILALLFRSQK
ncbi:MAG: polyprenol monophosphomannose synthase [Candidatus Nomurabacteria bacterium]|nr:MAG: polyprenol monophosphomannose synthase [Candidatus Nomurabacteria bacterium]